MNSLNFHVQIEFGSNCCMGNNTRTMCEGFTCPQRYLAYRNKPIKTKNYSRPI